MTHRAWALHHMQLNVDIYIYIDEGQVYNIATVKTHY